MSWSVSVLFKLDHQIDRQFPPMDRQFIRRCCLHGFSSPIHLTQLGKGPLVHPTITPDFLKKIKCISYVRQDQVYTHMIDIMSKISINNNKNVHELNHYIISLLHSDVRLEGLYNNQTITMKMQLHLHLPQAHDWGHANLRTRRSHWSTLVQCSHLNSGKQGWALLWLELSKWGKDAMLSRIG
jgi:hypothetical protein